MKQLNSFMVLAINGGSRISYIYDEIDDETGVPISTNNRGNFYAVDSALQEPIQILRKYIEDNKLKDK